MVGGKRDQRRAEQKFGVKTQFPNLSLHSAAASGNVGLVKFALTNGQPATSILNGIQPIHAACSGGNEASVRLLLEYGADVNAPRLPRRYNSDKKAAISVGTSGSTPLHFAAANGHLRIVELLLSCGGRPDLTEKRGLTPEDLARRNGHLAVCEALQKWDRHTAASEGVKRHFAENSKSTSRSTLPPPDIPPGAISPIPSMTNMGTSAAGNYAARMLSPEPQSHTGNGAHSINGDAPVSPSGSTTPDSASLLTRPATTYNSLTFEPNKSTSSLGSYSSSRRRPSLPSVLEKAAHPGATLKQALGTLGHGMPSNKPPPLKLTMSTSDAFGNTDSNGYRFQHSSSRRPSVSSSAKSSIASVFGKRSSVASATSPSMGSPVQSPDEGDEDRELGHNFLSQRRVRSDQSRSDSAEPHPSAQTRPSSSAEPDVEAYRPATVPITQTSFPSSVLETQPASATAATPPAAIHPVTYRPRKSSLMSNTGSIEQALDQSRISDTPLPAPALPWHTRSPSDGSGSGTSSIYSYGPAAHQNVASRAALELSSPSLGSEDDDSAQPALPSSHGAPSDSAPELSGSAEERDTFATTLQPATSFRPRSNSRLRADSTGSNSSTASHLSPFTVHAHSPLGTQPSSTDPISVTAPPPPLRQNSSSDVRPALSVYTRPKRSGSGSTEADLRHLVLSTANAPAASPSSPTSLSSWSGSNYLGSSAASTRATSDGHTIASVRDPPASPRKFYRSDITPQQAHSLVREAERSLLQYNPQEAASQLSLSEQLAIYGDRVNLEREVNQRERQKMTLQHGRHSHHHHGREPRERKFVWEKLDNNGHHSPLALADGEGRSIRSKPSSTFRRPDPYQQGNLDVRRPEAPSIRPPEASVPYSPAASSRMEIPPAVDPRLALRANLHKVYDHRAAALASQRPPRTPLQYTILESNQQHPSSVTPTGRFSPNSVDDPVRPAHMSTATSSTSSPTGSVINMRPSRSRLGVHTGGTAPGNATIKSRQSSGGGISSQSSPTRVSAALEEPVPPQPQLATPTAPRKAYEPVSGFEGLNMSNQPKGFLAKGLNRLRQGLQ